MVASVLVRLRCAHPSPRWGALGGCAPRVPRAARTPPDLVLWTLVEPTDGAGAGQLRIDLVVFVTDLIV